MLKLLMLAAPLLYAIAAFKLSTWQTKRNMERNSSPILDAKLCRINQKLADAAEVGCVVPRIYEVAPINGLVLPDGQVYVTRGLVDCYQQGKISAEELSSVIAHELGHLMLGHTKGRLADFASQNAARMALGMLLSRFVPFFGHMLAAGVLALFSNKMSRIDEISADAYASALLTKSGIGTLPQKTLLCKLPKLTGGGDNGVAWLMSHPRVSDRIAEIERREQRWNSLDA